MEGIVGIGGGAIESSKFDVNINVREIDNGILIRMFGTNIPASETYFSTKSLNGIGKFVEDAIIDNMEAKP